MSLSIRRSRHRIAHETLGLPTKHTKYAKELTNRHKAYPRPETMPPFRLANQNTGFAHGTRRTHGTGKTTHAGMDQSPEQDPFPSKPVGIDVPSIRRSRHRMARETHQIRERGRKPAIHCSGLITWWLASGNSMHHRRVMVFDFAQTGISVQSQDVTSLDRPG
jgi:hypothetical protein